jgi:hypothetical protein
MQWYRMDLHLHTPASADYQEPGVTSLDILQKAESRGVNIIALTDHNTVAGYRAMLDEVHELERLEELNRMRPEEKRRLDEYRRLLDKVLVLPGFEFTATFGFHILGIFSPAHTVRQLEHILLSLNIPPETLDRGDSVVGASSDVLTAYRAINQAGGIVIAAHVNSSHGVAMRGLGFGGQTKIAYTQDPNLHALEVTDLDRRGRHSTMRFFDGSKPEYPRPMRCIQASDAHRTQRDPKNAKNLGIGERVTEILLPELTFEAIYQVLTGSDFARTRPYHPTRTPFDHIQAARQEGPNIVQSFHESMTQRGGRLYAIIADVCAFANTNGGTIYVGVNANPKAKPAGLKKPPEAIEALRAEVERKINPPLEVDIDILETQGISILRVQVPPGDDPPYSIDDHKIYVRDETGTNLAVRDEIVQLVARNPSSMAQMGTTGEPDEHEAPPGGVVTAPRTGVEIISSERRGDTVYHRVRDLRNGNIVSNVTRESARKLWHYAITQKEDDTLDLGKVRWQGDLGLWQTYKRAGRIRYDLVKRDDDDVRVYYGVTEDGIHGLWRDLVGLSDKEEEANG